MVRTSEVQELHYGAGVDEMHVPLAVVGALAQVIWEGQTAVLVRPEVIIPQLTCR